ncbi:hypothetical protein Amal_03306 [Acetobacter malorum]|uniref:Uncharacterized protein n=1 Tax=Acetobacter malorum TaxID=178901 RepID=A0A177G8B4_9PROT|nr:hypothetical protein Amal_03306 [Acetobacter malorum]
MNNDFERLFGRRLGSAGEVSGQSFDRDMPYHHMIVDPGIRNMD